MTPTTNDTLALRYRPRKLAEVVGQDTAKKTLAGIFKTKRIPNAIMFVGASGIGKTTLARITARQLNCAKGNSCGKCPSCLQMDANGSRDHPDYMELNASEAGNIDNIRSLIQSAKYLPQNKLRIFMLDEVHRASHAAIQALLVPVETPPQRTLWLFATTDPDKIPNGKALMGRCQMLELSPPSKRDIADRLLEVGKKEGMSWLNDKLAETAAECSGGQVRNALQILERTALAVSELKKPKPKEIASVMEGAWRGVDSEGLDELAFNLLLGIYSGKTKQVLRACLDAPDPVTLLARAATTNSNAMGLSLLGKHGELWNSRPIAALLKALEDVPAKRKSPTAMAKTTTGLLDARSKLFAEGQQHPKQYAAAKMVELVEETRK